MGPLTYQLELPNQWRVNKVFHRSKLHPVTKDEIQGRQNRTTNPMTTTNKVPNNEEAVINPEGPNEQLRPNHTQRTNRTRR